MITEKTISAVVRFTVPGFHCWPYPREGREYLGALHRHLFFVEVQLELEHEDREIEFHDLLDFAKENFPDLSYDQISSMSCEQMAFKLANKITLRFCRRVTVSVFEDNEVGAVVSLSQRPG